MNRSTTMNEHHPARPWRMGALRAWRGGALLALLALGACGQAEEPKAAPPAEVRHGVAEARLTTLTLTPEAVGRLGIETAVVESTTVARTRTLGGEVVIPPGQALTIAAPMAGTVLAPDGGAIPAAGAHLAKGTPLLRLVGLPRSEEELAIGEARFRQAEAEAERMSRLLAEGLVAGREHERAQADLAAARAQVDAARARQALVTHGMAADPARLAPLLITAPAPGVLWELRVAPGQSVAAGAPLAQVVRLDRLWVRVPVYAGEARRLGGGAPALIHPLGGARGAPLQGVPVAAPPSADPLAAAVDLYFEVRGAGNALRPGERVSVSLPLAGEATRSLAVPLAAVVHDMNGGEWVYERVDSLTFTRRRIQIDRVVGQLAVLARGPAPGTTVVTAGVAELFGAEFGIGK